MSDADGTVHVLDRQGVWNEAASLVERLTPHLLREVDRPGWSFSVLLTDGEGIASYNLRYKERDEPTDVLAFPGEPGDEDEDGRPYLGDLVISVEQAREQAPAYGNSPEEELQVLVIHGVLHLLGMDHETDAGEMEQREGALRARLVGDGVG